MDVISLGLLLEYLYDKFVVTFILCLIGGIIRETASSAMKQRKMNASKMMASVVLASALMCALVDYVKVPFSIYTIICILVGIWAPILLKLIMNTKFMARLVSNIAANMKDPIAKGISTALNELDEDVKRGEDNEPTEDKMEK